LRVTAQLIDAVTGYHLWSGDYDREMRQIVETQDEIAADIANALELRMPPREAQSRKRSPNLQAYDLYLRALYLRDTFTPEGLRQARQYLDRAIELDRDFAPAYALKATVLAPAIYWQYIPLASSLEETRAAITRALELEPELAEAHGALGMVRLFFDGDFPGAERELRRAVELNPNDHHAWHQLANYYRILGRPEDAARASAHAVAVDPLNVRMGLMLATDHASANRFDEALAQYRRFMRLDPSHPMILGLGPNAPIGPWLVYWKQGRNQEVVDEYARIASIRGASAPEVSTLRSAHASGGMPAFWRSWLEFDRRHSGGNPNPVRVATYHALAGGVAEALEWLERAHAERNPALMFVYTDPAFAEMRGDPRFRRIFQRLNFPAS
jgi:serine/threonine-protein kinase